MNEFLLSDLSVIADICVEEEAHSGVKRIANKLQEDIFQVTGQRPELITNERNNHPTIRVATYQNSLWLDQCIKENIFNENNLKNKREVFFFGIIRNQLAIIGSDKRGTIYGMFHLSELIGISPLTYFYDVAVKKQSCIRIDKSQEMLSKEPSVRYRGFFINDEWPCFGNWTFEHFHGFTAQMYDHIFELLLRLKGNYLWPAMWSSSFCLDGPGMESALLADEYGVIIGNSHHEPCLRASEEWDKVKGKDSIYGLDWNYAKNKDGLLRYWEDGLKRGAKLETMITIGMRGERDTSMLGDDSSLSDNIELLRDIIHEQKLRIQKYVNPDLSKVPMLLALYKEVEQYYYGDANCTGLNEFEELDGVTLMLCEDNYGNMRTLPTDEMRTHKGGFGMYYHLDYHGGPISYEWINSTPLEKIWEQMTQAYEYGVKEVWIVNVGDLKNNEYPLNYFMNLAYDYDTWGIKAPNQTSKFTLDFIRQQFPLINSNTLLRELSELLEDAVHMTSLRRPEALESDTYHPVYDQEAQYMYNMAQDMINRAEKLYQQLPSECITTYFYLIYFPCSAAANLIRMQTAAGLNMQYALSGKIGANRYEYIVNEAIVRDLELTQQYKTRAQGKWSGFERASHIGFTHWNDEDWRYPLTVCVHPVPGSKMIVNLAGDEQCFTSGTIENHSFMDYGTDTLVLELHNGGDTVYSYEIMMDCEWLSCSLSKGEIQDEGRLIVKCNKEILKGKATANITIKGANQEVHLLITAQPEAKREDIDATKRVFVPQNGIIAIEANHFSRKTDVLQTEWKELCPYGIGKAGMKVFPLNRSFTLQQAAPELFYDVWLPKPAAYNIELWTAPSNPLTIRGSQNIGLIVNQESVSCLSTIEKEFKAGVPANRYWSRGVLDQKHVAQTCINLKQGSNQLVIHAMDAGIVLERIVMYPKDTKRKISYLGPKESNCFFNGNLIEFDRK